MKKLAYLLILTFVFSLSALAQSQTVKFKVNGKCSMCEKKIEKAATSFKAVSKAEWDKKTNMLKLTYDKKKIDLLKIKQAIAKIGYDTDEVKANKKAYNALPACCKYERDIKKTKDDVMKKKDDIMKKKF
jgi:copper chaperone CopZ